jgi:hypothetical protein
MPDHKRPIDDDPSIVAKSAEAGREEIVSDRFPLTQTGADGCYR